MSSIDKVHITLPKRTDDNRVQELYMGDLMRNAHRAGMIYVPAGTQFKGPTLRFVFEDDDMGQESIFVQYRRKKVGKSTARFQERDVVTKVMFNPARFGDTVSSIRDVLRLDVDGIIERAPVGRLDIKMDYTAPTGDYFTQVDLINKRYNQVYVDSVSGVPQTNYWGKTPDNLCIYNRIALLRSVDPLIDIPDGNVIRIERRLQTTKAIRDALRIQDNLRLPTLPRVLDLIASGSFEPLSGVTLKDVAFPDETHLRPTEAKQIGKMEAVAEIGGYALMRRRFKNHPLLRLVRVEELPAASQPSALLRAAVVHEIQNAPHR